MQQITTYLNSKKVEFKENETQYNIVCPQCGDGKWGHFYINKDNGLWSCRKCGIKGNWKQFQERLGDPGKPLEITPEEKKMMELQAKTRPNLNLDKKIVIEQNGILVGTTEGQPYMKYLEKDRGLTEETIKHFKLGLQGDKITIPIYDEHDNLINIRTRKNPFVESDEPKYKSMEGAKSSLYNIKVLEENPKRLIFCEGEFDMMLLWQKGVKNVISTTGGASYFSPEWSNYFKTVHEIIFLYDNDKAGVEGALKAAKKIGEHKCKIVVFPEREDKETVDITDFFIKYGGTTAQLDELVKNTDYLCKDEHDSIKHISEFNEELKQGLLSGQGSGIPTGFAEFDKLYGGLRRGTVTLFSGLTSIGKTTSSVNIFMGVAKNFYPSLFISMEMTPIDICKKVIAIHADISNKELNPEEGLESDDEIVKIVDETLLEFKGEADGEKIPLYIFNNSGTLDFDKVVTAIKVGKESFGIDLIVVDHLHYFSDRSGTRTDQVSFYIRELKRLALEYDVAILALAHLNRSGRQQQKKGFYVPALSDLRDSGALEQDSDGVIFGCRDSEAVSAEDKKKMVWKIAKNRNGDTGYVSIHFNLDTGAVAEEKSIDYYEEMINKKPEKKAKGKGLAQSELPVSKSLTQQQIIDY